MHCRRPRRCHFVKSSWHDDALIVVPGMVIDRSTFLGAVAKEEPWSTHHIHDPQVVRLGVDSAALVYEVTARRDGQDEFRGTLTSVYAERGRVWRLVLHQQTPVPVV